MSPVFLSPAFSFFQFDSPANFGPSPFSMLPPLLDPLCPNINAEIVCFCSVKCLHVLHRAEIHERKIVNVHVWHYYYYYNTIDNCRKTREETMKRKSFVPTALVKVLRVWTACWGNNTHFGAARAANNKATLCVRHSRGNIIRIKEKKLWNIISESELIQSWSVCLFGRRHGVHMGFVSSSFLKTCATPRCRFGEKHIFYLNFTDCFEILTQFLDFSPETKKSKGFNKQVTWNIEDLTLHF